MTRGRGARAATARAGMRPASAPDDGAFADAVIDWQKTHGRHALPWQGTRDPYRVWLSEVMLQQTQVETVRAYYERFLGRFPDVAALAAAPLSEVLALWSGLGYYSRARNLHRCAETVMSQHGGAFPRTAAELAQLPGIGRSTAGAIAAFCFGERAAIMDGNVRRVLARVLAFDGDLAQTAAMKRLWQHAEELLPRNRLAQSIPRYTQGMMDLGAGICTQRNPACLLCPVQSHCAAFSAGRVTDFPVRTRKLKRSSEALWLLYARAADGAIWLAERPTPGVWAGLHCFPAFESFPALAAAVPARYRERLLEQPPVVHILTHKTLHLHPVFVEMSGTPILRCV